MGVELAVGAARTPAAGGTGTVYAVFLTASGTTDRIVELTQPPGLASGDPDDGDSLGYALAPLGDLNGNGQPELAIGAIRDDEGGTDRGTFYVVSLETPMPLPEPGTVLGLASGIAFLAAIGRKRIRR